MSDELPTDVVQLQADLLADRETIRLLASQLVKRDGRFSPLELYYLTKRGTFRPTQKLRRLMQTYCRGKASRPS